MARRTEVAAGALALAAALYATPVAAAPLKVCMAADNPPLSWQAGGAARGLDVRIARAAAESMGRELVVVPFESEYEKESTLAHEVNALLSAGICEAASGFPLIAGDFGPPSRASSRTPDYPGAKRKRERPYITLGPLAAGRAYQAVALGLVQRGGTTPVTGLTDLGDRKIGVTSGTLGGTMALTWRNGTLRSRLVSLGQRDDLLGELARPDARFEVALLPLAMYDGWRLQHADATLVASPWRRPIGVNLGFVTLQAAADVRAALDGTITSALADGRLARWAADEGVSWSAPTTPEVSRGPSLADLAAD